MIGKLQADCRAMLASEKEARGAFDRIRGELSEAKSALASLQSEHAHAAEEASTAHAKHKGMADIVSRLQEDVEARVTAQVQKDQQHKAQVQAVRAQLQTAEASIRRLKAHLRETAEENGRLEDQHAEEQARMQVPRPPLD